MTIIQDWRVAEIMPIEALISTFEGAVSELMHQMNSPKTGKKERRFLINQRRYYTKLLADLHGMQKFGVDMIHIDPPRSDMQGSLWGMIVYEWGANSKGVRIPTTYGTVATCRVPPALATMYRNTSFNTMKPAYHDTMRPSF